jgi:hypothetical protein
VLASVAGEVAVVAVDHGQAGFSKGHPVQAMRGVFLGEVADDLGRKRARKAAAPTRGARR